MNDLEEFVKSMLKSLSESNTDKDRYLNGYCDGLEMVLKRIKDEKDLKDGK